MEDEKEFKKRLLAAFAAEAAEHIKAVSEGLAALENQASGQEPGTLIENIFREMHSLKGAARAVDMTDVEAVCQTVESIFALWKRGKSDPAREHFEVLYQAVDALEERLSSGQPGVAGFSDLLEKLSHLASGDRNEPGVRPVLTQERSGFPNSDSFPRIQKETFAEIHKQEIPVEIPKLPADTVYSGSPEIFRQQTGGEIRKPEPVNEISVQEEKKNLSSDNAEPAAPVLKKTPLTDTIRIPVKRLDALFLQIEEMLSAKLAAAGFVSDIRNLRTTVEQWHRECEKSRKPFELTAKDMPDTVRAADKSRPENQLPEFVSQHQVFVNHLQGMAEEMENAAKENHRALSRMVDQSLEDMKKILMLPFSSLAEIFPKMVRSLCADQSKEAVLVLEGGSTEIDRRVLEEMKDPLIHLIRNAIDHGIESPARRMQKGKDRQGRILVRMSQMGADRAELVFSDDGQGIDVEKVKAAALSRGMLSPSQARSFDIRAACQMIFQSDLSTSPMITDISGRGIGLSIVQEKAEKLGGRIAVESEQGKGITFRILLPLSLSTFRGIFIEVCDQVFLVPTLYVDRVMRIAPEEIQTVENRDTIIVNDKTLALVPMDRVLEIGGKNFSTTAAYVPALLLRYGNERVAFSVSGIIREEEGLVKQLGPQLPRVKAVAGAVIYGRGKIAPILHVQDLMKCAQNAGQSRMAEAKPEERETETKSVLVADDSVTSRMLLKNILESAGYRVRTAADGVDAFLSAKENMPDLLVSDVEMPKMDGFSLTERIRADKNLSDLPIVLVTARENREDKERGIEAGSNAYIAKSSFDQNSLLEVVRRLVGKSGRSG